VLVNPSESVTCNKTGKTPPVAVVSVCAIPVNMQESAEFAQIPVNSNQLGLLRASMVRFPPPGSAT
jgi:hypothetical protein